MLYGDKRGCSIKCSSECCYFPRPGQPIEKRDIEKIKKAAKNLSDFHPKYRDIISRTVESGEFLAIRTFDTYLRCDTTKLGFDSAMVPYYPCVFLTNAESLTRKNKTCMIYPHRPSFCINTNSKDCLPGLIEK